MKIAVAGLGYPTRFIPATCLDRISARPSLMSSIKLFETKQVRSLWDEGKEAWFFSIVDVVAVLTDSVDAPAYWRKLKQRLKAESNETVTNCHGLKMPALDGKMRLTDVADTEQLLRLIQSIPSPKPLGSHGLRIRSAMTARGAMTTL